MAGEGEFDVKGDSFVAEAKCGTCGATSGPVPAEHIDATIDYHSCDTPDGWIRPQTANLISHTAHAG